MCLSHTSVLSAYIGSIVYAKLLYSSKFSLCASLFLLTITCVGLCPSLACDSTLRKDTSDNYAYNKKVVSPSPAADGIYYRYASSSHNDSFAYSDVNQVNKNKSFAYPIFPASYHARPLDQELTERFYGAASMPCPADSPILCGKFPFFYCVAAGRKCCSAPDNSPKTSCQQAEQCCASESNAVCCAPNTHCTVARKTANEPAWARCVDDDICSAFDDVDSCINNNTAQTAGCGWCCTDQRCVSVGKRSMSNQAHAGDDDVSANPRQTESSSVCHADRYPITAGQQCASQCAYATTCEMCIASNRKTPRLSRHDSVAMGCQATRVSSKHKHRDNMSSPNEMCQANSEMLFHIMLDAIFHGKINGDHFIRLHESDECVWCCATMTCMPISEMPDRCDNMECVDSDTSCAGCMYNGTGTDQVFISGYARLLLAVSSLVAFVGVLSLFAVFCDILYNFANPTLQESDENSQLNAQQAIRRYGFELFVGKAGSLSGHMLQAQLTESPSLPPTAVSPTRDESIDEIGLSGAAGTSTTMITPLTGEDVANVSCETHQAIPLLHSTNQDQRQDEQNTATTVASRLPPDHMRDAEQRGVKLESAATCIIATECVVDTERPVPSPVACASDKIVLSSTDQSMKTAVRARNTLHMPHVPRALENKKIQHISCDRCHQLLQISRLEAHALDPAHTRLTLTSRSADAVVHTMRQAISPALKNATTVDPPPLAEKDAAGPLSLSKRPIFVLAETYSEAAGTHQRETSNKLAAAAKPDDGVALLFPCNHRVCYSCTGIEEACKKVFPDHVSDTNIDDSTGVHIRENDANAGTTRNTHSRESYSRNLPNPQLATGEPLDKVEKRLRRYCKNKCPVCAHCIEDIMLTENILLL